MQPASSPAPAAADRFLTLSNMLSLLRALLAVPFALVMLSGRSDATLWGIVILAVAALTDKLDGVFARKYNQITDWGKILDPLADKIGIVVVAVVLVWLNLLPLWFVIVMALRDVLILAGGLFVKKRFGVILSSNTLGKWTIGVLAVTMLLAMVGVSLVVLHVAIIVSLVVLALSFALYCRRFIEIMQAGNVNTEVLR